MIPDPETNGRLLIALDDFINPKTGKKIFACTRVFDHAAKLNQSKYPWAQNIVSIGLLKMIKGRWACMPLSHRFYHLKKEIGPAGAFALIENKMQYIHLNFRQFYHLMCIEKFYAPRIKGETPIIACSRKWYIFTSRFH